MDMELDQKEKKFQGFRYLCEPWVIIQGLKEVEEIITEELIDQSWNFIDPNHKGIESILYSPNGVCLGMKLSIKGANYFRENNPDINHLIMDQFS